MFEHLSDTDPPALGDAFRDRVVDAARARQRRTRLAMSGVALIPLLIVGGAAVYVRDQAGELERIDVPGLAPVGSLPAVVDDAVVPTPSVADAPPIVPPLNVLVAGVDRRPPGSDVVGSRADTIAVVRIDPQRQRVGVLSLPRDLWVDTAGGPGRLNSFSEDGGLAAVVSSLLGVEINHYVEVDFEGFESLIDLAGGVAVPFDLAVRDRGTGFAAGPGCAELSGADALAYVRSRHLEQLDPVSGEWTPDPRADLGRIARQQDLMRRVYVAVLTADHSLADRARLLADVVDDLTVDQGLDLDGVRAIFNAAAAIGPENFETFDLTASATGETIDGKSVLVADPAGIEIQVRRLLGEPVAETSDSATPPIHRDAIEPAAVGC